jgi:hypothetical protein
VAIGGGVVLLIIIIVVIIKCSGGSKKLDEERDYTRENTLLAACNTTDMQVDSHIEKQDGMIE